jgi:DNA polymerase III alpha subunit
MKERQRLLRLCVRALEEKQVANDPRYKDRLKQEIREIDAQAEHQYLLDLHDKCHEEGVIFPENENNLLVDHLLGLSPSVDIDEEPRWVQGEFPDIDIDFIKAIRDYLKRDWAAKTFGQDKICEIGTYGTSGIKSAILDMTGVHGMSKGDIQSITVKIEDKDDEGKSLEWEKIFEIATFQIGSKKDIERLKRLQEEGSVDWEAQFTHVKGEVIGRGDKISSDSPYVRFAEYCEEYPEVGRSARLAIGRNRSGGVHAGGLIISDRPIDGFVPLEVRSVKKDTPKGVICSAWTEGLNAQDLQPVGLIKFDLLVINNLMQIAIACNLVKERHGLEAISAVEGGWDWSDISYLNDPKALEMANRADLKCIFQFDSDGIRKLVKRGGVDSFDDLAAYSALYRPGPLNEGMDVHYCKRKKGEEPYNLHPLMQPILGKTYGVMVFQEQVMEMLRVIGSIPDMHTEKVRKAISKKKVRDFIKYKEMFVENGQKNLGVNAKFLLDLWDQIESFAEYGFNKSHAYAYTYISARLLWLKAHYPLEFYCAILACEKDEDKFRQYKLDAKYHGIEICPVDINKSGVNFQIVDDKIYFGFKNIKGVGVAPAASIVANQPYEGIRDFLDKFGTDAGTLKALCAIGVFDELEPDYDREHIRKFHEFYKDHLKKRRERQRRFELSMEKKKSELCDTLLFETNTTHPDFMVMCSYTEAAEELWEKNFAGLEREVEYKSKGQLKKKTVLFTKLLHDLARKRATSLKGFHEKEKDDDENPVTLDQFNPATIKLDDEELAILRSEMTLNGNTTYPVAESLYYGFQWTHVLETSPSYTGRTFDVFMDEVENQGVTCASVQVYVRSVRKRTSKGGTEFYSVDLEDANARRMVMNVWMDDYLRWRGELKKDTMLSILVRPPSGGFNTLTFKSVPKRERKYLPPKEDDERIMVMKPQEKPKEAIDPVDLGIFDFDPDLIDGLEDLL